MTVSEIALLISSFGTVITATGGVYIAYTSKKSNKAVQEVHHLVNKAADDAKRAADDARRYRSVLERALIAAGVSVPEDQSEITIPVVSAEGIIP